MASSYTSSADDLPYPLKFLINYDSNRFLRTSIKNVRKIGHLLSEFALRHLLGPLDPADCPLPLKIL